MARRRAPPQPVAVASCVGCGPHLPVTHAAPASHFMPQVPQLSASAARSVQTAAAPAPHVSGLSAGQVHTFSLQKPPPEQSPLLTQAPPGAPVPPPPPPATPPAT